MANTYYLIASNVLGASAASVTFSSIPATYTDLILKYSARTDAAQNTSMINLTFNGDSSTIYSGKITYGFGTSAATSVASGTSYLQIYNSAPAAGATSNTFSNGEIYIPQYQSGGSKQVSINNGTENNSATVNTVIAEAGLYRNTSAITSLTLVGGISENFVANSSFYLYGIKNS